MTAPVEVATPGAAEAPSGGRRWGQRPALDGVRTVAVYLVVLFHAGLARAEGGFIGVDLFFVLSGFLVTNVLLTDIAGNGRVRLARFYARRVRRLLPAACLMIVGTAVAWVMVAAPAERVAIIGDARAALLYVANWHFIAGASDYFQADATAASPYLHFWSLSIEEQFYFVFPITLVGLSVLARRRGRPAIVPLGLAGLGALSLAAQIGWAQTDTLRAYYGTDARLYQMLAGAALAAAFATWTVPRPFRRASRGAGPLALVGFVVLATDVVDVSPSTRGIGAMLVAVVLLASLELDLDAPTPKVLGGASLVYLGQISYGTYLWHWPVILVAGRIGDFSAPELALISIVLGTALAALSHALVELPVRRSPRLDPIPVPVVVTGLCGGVLLAFVVVPAILESDRPPSIDVTEGVTVADPSRYGEVPTDVDWNAVIEDRGPEPPDCRDGPATGCMVVEGDGPHLHLVGDSHARMMLPTFERIAEEHGLALSASYRAGCPWQQGQSTTDKTETGEVDCAAFQDDQYERVIPELDPDVVVVMSLARDDPNHRTDDLHVGGNTSLRRTTRASVEVLGGIADHVVILEPVPIAPFLPIPCLSAATQVAECIFDASGPLGSEDVYRDEASSNAAISVDLDRLACPELPRCVPILDDVIVRRDESHFTEQYAQHIADGVYRALVDRGALPVDGS